MMSRLCAIALACCLAALPPAASANKVKKLSISGLSGFDKAPEIEVYSTSGERWTDVDKTDMSRFTVALNAECQYEGRGNKAYNGTLYVPGFVASGEKEPANFLIPHASTASGVFRWQDGKGQQLDPVAACNEELAKRAANSPNKTKYHFLAEGFRINYPAAFVASYSLTCKPTGAGFADMAKESAMVNARIKCDASPLAESKLPAEPTRPKRAAVARIAKPEPLLSAASFEADPEVHVGSCPAPIRFTGTMTATRAGTVRYQYISQDDRKSPVFELVFKAAGSQATRDWHTTVSPPKSGASLSAGGADSGDIQGWYRMDVLSPEPPAHVVAHYRVVCDDSVSGKPAVLKPVPATGQKDPRR